MPIYFYDDIDSGAPGTQISNRFVTSWRKSNLDPEVQRYLRIAGIGDTLPDIALYTDTDYWLTSHTLYKYLPGSATHSNTLHSTITPARQTSPYSDYIGYQDTIGTLRGAGARPSGLPDTIKMIAFNTRLRRWFIFATSELITRTQTWAIVYNSNRDTLSYDRQANLGGVNVFVYQSGRFPDGYSPLTVGQALNFQLIAPTAIFSSSAATWQHFAELGATGLLESELPGKAVIPAVALPDGSFVNDAVYYIIPEEAHYTGEQFNNAAPDTISVTIATQSDSTGASEAMGDDAAFGTIHGNAAAYVKRFAYDNDSNTIIARIVSYTDPGDNISFAHGTLGTYRLAKRVGRGAALARNAFVDNDNKYQYSVTAQTDPFTLGGVVGSTESFTVTPDGTISYYVKESVGLDNAAVDARIFRQTGQTSDQGEFDDNRISNRIARTSNIPAASNAAPAETGDSNVIGTSTRYARQDHVHRGDVTTPIQNAINAFLRTNRGSSEIDITWLPDEVQQVARALQVSGNVPWPSGNTTIEIAGPISQTAATSIQSGTTWSDTISIDASGAQFYQSPANFLIRFDISEYATLPTIADLANAGVRIGHQNSSRVQQITSLTAISVPADPNHLYAAAAIPSKPAGDGLILEMYRKLTIDIDLAPNTVAPADLIMDDADRVNLRALLYGAGKFTSTILRTQRDLINGNITGLTVTSASSNSAISRTNFTSTLDLDDEPHGEIGYTFTLTMNTGFTSLGFDAAGLKTITYSGNTSVDAIGRFDPYNGTTNLGETVAIIDCYNGSVTLGAILIYIARNAADNRAFIVMRYVADTGHTDSSNFSISAVAEVVLFGSSVPRESSSGVWNQDETTLPVASAYAPGSNFAVHSGAAQGAYYNKITRNHVAADTGLGGLSLTRSGLATRTVVNYAHQYYSKVQFNDRRSRTTPIPAGGTWADAPAVLNTLDFNYRDSTRLDGQISFSFTSARTYTGRIIVVADNNRITVNRIDATTWLRTGLTGAQISALRNAATWTFEEPDATGYTETQSWERFLAGYNNSGAIVFHSNITSTTATHTFTGADATAAIAALRNRMVYVEFDDENGHSVAQGVAYFDSARIDAAAGAYETFALVNATANITNKVPNISIYVTSTTMQALIANVNDGNINNNAKSMTIRSIV